MLPASDSNTAAPLRCYTPQISEFRTLRSLNRPYPTDPPPAASDGRHEANCALPSTPQTYTILLIVDQLVLPTHTTSSPEFSIALFFFETSQMLAPFPIVLLFYLRLPDLPNGISVFCPPLKSPPPCRMSLFNRSPRLDI